MIRRPPRSTRTDTLSLHDALPIFQGKLVYDGKLGGVATRLCAAGIRQKHDVIAGPDYTGWGWDAGAKVTVGPLTLVGTYYDASGLGPTALNLFAHDGTRVRVG